MKILVFEFICGGGCYAFPSFGEPCGSLFAEGSQMLSALLEELNKVSDVQPIVPIDSRCSDRLNNLGCESNPGCEKTIIRSAVDLHTFLQQAGRSCDHHLVIAPEIDNALKHFCVALQPYRKLISPGSDVVDLCSDKWKSAKFLSDHQINTPRTILAEHFVDQFGDSEIIVKPRLGAGGWGVKRFGNTGDNICERKKDVQAYMTASGLTEQAAIIQEYVSGRPSSIAVWKTAKRCFYFPAMRQTFEKESYTFDRADGPLPQDQQIRAEKLAAELTSLLPDFRGYLGIDLILGNEESENENHCADRSIRDYVLDINPRLTTSFCQTRKLIESGVFAELFIESCGG